MSSAAGANSSSNRPDSPTNDSFMYTLLSSGNLLSGVGLSIAQLTPKYTLVSQGLFINAKGNPSKIILKNMSTRAVNTMKFGKYVKMGGDITTIAGIALDGYAYSQGYISKEKFAVNTGVTAVGYGLGFTGPIGIVAGVAVVLTYNGIDSFYPGGWEGFGRDQYTKDKSLWQIGPKY